MGAAQPRGDAPPAQLGPGAGLIAPSCARDAALPSPAQRLLEETRPKPRVPAAEASGRPGARLPAAPNLESALPGRRTPDSARRGWIGAGCALAHGPAAPDCCVRPFPAALRPVPHPSPGPYRAGDAAASLPWTSRLNPLSNLSSEPARPSAANPGTDVRNLQAQPSPFLFLLLFFGFQVLPLLPRGPGLRHARA